MISFLKIVIAIYFIFIFNIKNSLCQNENDKVELISIVAIVNDEPITIMDLNDRMQLIIVSSNLPNNIATKKNTMATLKAIKAYINQNTKSIFLPGVVNGQFKEWTLQEHDILYNAKNISYPPEKLIYNQKTVSLFKQKRAL